MLPLPELHLAHRLLLPHLPRLRGALDAAPVLRMTASWYRRHTRLVWRRTPQQVLDELRLLRATELLHDPSVPCWAVGPAIGIEDEAYLARWFKRQTGQTMTALRRGLALAGGRKVQLENPTGTSNSTD